MEYKQLTLKTIPEYLKSISEMKKIFSSFDNLNVSEIGGKKNGRYQRF